MRRHELRSCPDPRRQAWLAAEGLVASLVQRFGYPETLQMTTDGVIRSQYWDSRGYGSRVQELATQAKIDTTQDTVG
ncbi:hypothetical protein AB0F96_30005 [Streptomyces sp. NPDC023998]|uniref:hypothetical protein n=1 Tax=Streptomyces sp. NPDC023998 TaxID=3154597 RepID=UPI0033D1CDD4